VRVVRRLLALVAVVAAMAIVPGASAHGGAVLNALSSEDVSIPTWSIGGEYAVSPQLLRQLRSVTARSRRLGDEIKVAVIVGPDDTVDVPSMFGHPKEYAEFIGSALRDIYGFQGSTLVVMPMGAAVWSPNPQRTREANQRIAAIQFPVPGTVDGAAAAAVRAVQLVHAGPPAAVSPRSRGIGTTALAVGSAAGAILAGGLAMGGFLWRRRRLRAA
jgi:hypothetical protein